MSATIDQVAASLGVTVRAVRLRRDALGDSLDAHVRRGPNNELLFTGEGLAILRRVEELRHAESISVRQAASRVRAEIGGNSDERARQPETNHAATSDSSMMLATIEDLRRDRDAWRDLALKLQDQLALPAPRAARPRRRWWAPWHRSGK